MYLYRRCNLGSFLYESKYFCGQLVGPRELISFSLKSQFAKQTYVLSRHKNYTLIVKYWFMHGAIQGRSCKNSYVHSAIFHVPVSKAV